VRLFNVVWSVVGPTFVSFAFVLLVLPGLNSVEAQQSTRVVKVGELLFRDPTRLGPGRSAFRRQLSDLGYVEGKTIVYETRSANGNIDRFHSLAGELSRLKVDLLFASSTNEARALKSATKTVPIIFHITTDPIADGLVESLARPGGNITGVTTITTALAGKRLELLKETVPKLTRVALLWGSQGESSAQQRKESEVAAAVLGLQIHSIEANSADQFAEAFRTAVKAGNGAVSVTSGSLNTANPKLIADLAAKHKLPAIFERADFITSGGLMSYGPDRAESYRRAAVYVDKVLKGAKPAELPVEQPTKFELVINLKTAQQINLKIPPSVLARADRVIR
jgi:putative tryptophan/tyrosine transport system substrate-binding protein